VNVIDTPVPRSGECLVRIERSPINPSDLSTMSGNYNSEQKAPLPCQLGFEGSGQVVQSGGGVLAYSLVGKRVAVVSKGGGCTWAQYAIIPATQCVAITPDVSYEEGCAVFVNPLTAVAFIEIAQKRKLRSIVHTADASSLGKMLVRLGRRNNIDVICVVRRPEQVEELKKEGAKYILNSADANFKEQLAKMTADLDCRLGFDAVAGDLTGLLLTGMPPNSEVQVYGGLAGKAVGGLHPLDLVFKGKKVTGFWLTRYLKECKSLPTLILMTRSVVSRLKDDLRMEIAGTYPLEKLPQAIASYKANMSAGKVVMAPQEL